jgi:hypothetical protein
MSDLTQLLDNVNRRSTKAAEELLPLVYDELRRLAAGEGEGVELPWVEFLAFGRESLINRVCKCENQGDEFADDGGSSSVGLELQPVISIARRGESRGDAKR